MHVHKWSKLIKYFTNFLPLTFSKNALTLFPFHWLSSRQPSYPVPFQNTICYCICHFTFDLCGRSCDLSTSPHRVHIHTTPAEFHRSFPKMKAEYTTKIISGPVFHQLKKNDFSEGLWVSLHIFSIDLFSDS